VNIIWFSWIQYSSWFCDIKVTNSLLTGVHLWLISKADGNLGIPLPLLIPMKMVILNLWSHRLVGYLVFMVRMSPSWQVAIWIQFPSALWPRPFSGPVAADALSLAGWSPEEWNEWVGNLHTLGNPSQLSYWISVHHFWVLICLMALNYNYIAWVSLQPRGCWTKDHGRTLQWRRLGIEQLFVSQLPFELNSTGFYSMGFPLPLRRLGKPRGHWSWWCSGSSAQLRWAYISSECRWGKTTINKCM